MGARLASVLEVVYLVFNEGYAATSGGDWIRPALCEDALRLGRILCGLAPGEAEVHGLVALMEIQASRFAARTGPDGAPVLLLDQEPGSVGPPPRPARPGGAGACPQPAGSARGSNSATAPAPTSCPTPTTAAAARARAASCGATQACVGGSCTRACGLSLCGGKCVDLATDPGNCGQCGVACPSEYTCGASGSTYNGDAVCSMGTMVCPLSGGICDGHNRYALACCSGACGLTQGGGMTWIATCP